MLSDRAIERLERLDQKHLVVACQAIVQRLRLIHQAFDEGDRAKRIACVSAHDAAVEALLNLVSVVEQIDACHEAGDVARLRAGLERALESARDRGFEAFSR